MTIGMRRTTTTLELSTMMDYTIFGRRDDEKLTLTPFGFSASIDANA